MICLECKYFDAEQRYCRNKKAKYVGCDECYKANPKPTNADIIRSMTDEELAEVLHNAGGNWYSEEYWLDWLKEENEE